MVGGAATCGGGRQVDQPYCTATGKFERLNVPNPGRERPRSRVRARMAAKSTQDIERRVAVAYGVPVFAPGRQTYVSLSDGLLQLAGGAPGTPAQADSSGQVANGLPNNPRS